MSKFDGSPDPLTYGQALVEIATRIAWGHEAQGIEVTRAIQAEHGILPPDPDLNYADPVYGTLAAQDAEIAELKARIAKNDAEKAQADKDAELESLRAQAAAQSA
jgi:ATPase subunit of ABC transporter with duplicated ATPase domains